MVKCSSFLFSIAYLFRDHIINMKNILHYEIISQQNLNQSFSINNFENKWNTPFSCSVTKFEIRARHVDSPKVPSPCMEWLEARDTQSYIT